MNLSFSKALADSWAVLQLLALAAVAELLLQAGATATAVDLAEASPATADNSNGEPF